MAWRERIEALYRRAATRPETIALGGGFPAPQLFPSDALARSSQRVLHALGERVLQYDWPEGREDLRAWIAERLARRGLVVAPERLLVTSGAQQALAIAAEVLLAPGQAIEVEAATYPGALEIFQPTRHARRLALRVCFSGVRAEDLDEGARRLAAAWRAYRRRALQESRRDEPSS